MAGLASKTYNPSELAPFKIEMATSGRSKCRNPQCPFPKRTIRKGELRIARMEQSPTEALNDRLYGKLMPKWVHLQCCAPVILQEAVTRYGGIEAVPGYDDLGPTKICQDPHTEAQELTRSILALASTPAGPTAGASLETTSASPQATKKLAHPKQKPSPNHNFK